MKGKAKSPVRRFHLDKRAETLVAAPGSDDQLLSTRELAAEWGVSEQFLESLRHRGGGPRYTRPAPKVIKYKRDWNREWLNERSHAHTAEYEDIEKKRASGKRLGRPPKGGGRHS